MLKLKSMHFLKQPPLRRRQFEKRVSRDVPTSVLKERRTTFLVSQDRRASRIGA